FVLQNTIQIIIGGSVGFSVFLFVAPLPFGTDEMIFIEFSFYADIETFTFGFGHPIVLLVDISLLSFQLNGLIYGAVIKRFSVIIRSACIYTPLIIIEEKTTAALMSEIFTIFSIRINISAQGFRCIFFQNNV